MSLHYQYVEHSGYRLIAENFQIFIRDPGISKMSIALDTNGRHGIRALMIFE